MSFMTPTLKEALADLYVIDKQYEKAFAIYADLRKPGIFEFIEEHNLHDALQDKALALMTLDPKRAVALLVQQREFIKPSEVVSQLQKAENNSTYRYLLHEYLHALFETDPHAGKDFHGLQVELYAEYEPRLLLPFLRNSQHYSLMHKTPRLIDFDNKRSFFCSRIRQQNEQHNYNPLRICVRRTYVLEDSYNQLRMRSVDNSKKSSLDDNSKGNSPFMKILGKPLGYMTTDEQHRVMNISWMPLRHSHMTMKISSVWFGASICILCISILSEITDPSSCTFESCAEATARLTPSGNPSSL